MEPTFCTVHPTLLSLPKMSKMCDAWQKPQKQVCWYTHTQIKQKKEHNLSTLNVNDVIKFYLHFAATSICELFIPLFTATFYKGSG